MATLVNRTMTLVPTSIAYGFMRSLPANAEHNLVMIMISTIFYGL